MACRHVAAAQIASNPPFHPGLFASLAQGCRVTIHVPDREVHYGSARSAPERELI